MSNKSYIMEIFQLSHYDVIQKFSHQKNALANRFFFVLDGVEFPENIGHFLRLSESLWLSKLLIANLHNNSQIAAAENVSRKSSIPVQIIEDLSEYMKTTSWDIDFIAVEVTNTSIDFWDYIPAHWKAIGLICGSEKHGVSEEVLKLTKTHLHIPMLWTMSSINVSHAGAIVAYHILKTTNTP